MNTARQDMGASGIQTDAIVFAGQVVPGSVSTATEGYDGTSWTTLPNVATAGTASAGLLFGGITATAPSSATEEFTGAALGTKTVTTS